MEKAKSFRWEDVDFKGPGASGSGGSRRSHSATLVGGKIFVVGGRDIEADDKYNSNVHILDYVRQEWIAVKFRSVARQAVLRRESHAAWLENDYIYIYGGESENMVLNDLWRMDTMLLEFERCTFQGEVPEGRRRCSGSYLERLNVLIIFGGSSEDSYKNTVAMLRCDLRKWVSPKIKGKSPAARRAHASCVVGNSVYIYGGHSLSRAFNDLHKLSYNGHGFTWSRVKVKNQSAFQGRHTSTLTNVGDRLFIFGGADFFGEDVLVYSISEGLMDDITSEGRLSKESRYSVEGKGSRRSAHTAVYASDTIFVLGGHNNSLMDCAAFLPNVPKATTQKRRRKIGKLYSRRDLLSRTLKRRSQIKTATTG